MRLYRFLKAEYGLKSIREKRLRIGRLEELNDDFEMIGLALAEKAERIALREVRRQLHVGSGVLCMSKSWSSPQMWEHYADSHQGMVLGFDVPDDPERFMRVDYVEKRPSLADFGHKTLDELTADDMNRLIGTKAAGWSYEDEYRAFVSLEEGEEINGAMHYFAVGGHDTIVACRELITDAMPPLEPRAADKICLDIRDAYQPIADAVRALQAEERRRQREEEEAELDALAGVFVYVPPPAPPPRPRREPFPAEVRTRHIPGGYMGSTSIAVEGSLEDVERTMKRIEVEWFNGLNPVIFKPPEQIGEGRWLVHGRKDLGTD